MAPPDNVLERILHAKREEVAYRRAHTDLGELAQQARAAAPTRNFLAALDTMVRRGRPGVIAEMKKASPGKGVLRENYQPALLARSYERHGAACVSVLTDLAFFHGDLQHILEAKAACTLPILRKDFIVDEYQVYESRAAGADAILLIAAALEPSHMAELAELARSLNLTVLVEVHALCELQPALQARPALLGINNRSLKTFETSLRTTLDLLPALPPELRVVSESGLQSHADLEFLRSHGVHAFLVGEALMKAPDPGLALSALIEERRLHHPAC